MTLEERGDTVRMTECPFCDEDLSDKPPANHLKVCEGFYAAADVEPPDYARTRSPDDRAEETSDGTVPDGGEGDV